MVEFKTTATGIVLEYAGDQNWGANTEWVWTELKKGQTVEISKMFRFNPADLINPPSPRQDFENYTYCFNFGSFNDNYISIPGRILNIKNDLFIDRTVRLKRSIFAAERNISIFGRLSNLLDHSRPILIGGTHADAIPLEVFEELIKKFPNTYELNRYADARVQTILSQHLDGLKDARGRYEDYLNRTKLFANIERIDLSALQEIEIEKYLLIRELIQDALQTKNNWAETDWQQLMKSFLLILFPKYIKVLENVAINDYYSNPTKKTTRFIDLALIDFNGNIDIIEVKKPFDDKILRKSRYRGNSIPTSELSGTIMQAEKYLFHLSKWGVKGEKILTDRYSADLPTDMKIRVSNPKAIVIIGRDQIGDAAMDGSQLLDFEIIKRKYANVIDVITYDDLLRRLANTIAALGGSDRLR
jgi:hypothetical protein